MKPQNRKPILITLAALLTLLLAAAALSLILHERGRARFSGGEDAPYPYSWVERSSGTITLTVETGDGSAWLLGSTEGSAVDIRVGKSWGGRTKVTLKPTAEGREDVTLQLMKGEDRLAELSITVAVRRRDERASSAAATIIAHSERVFQGTVSGGAETGHPFTVRGSDEGLVIFIEEPVGYADERMAWASESSDSLVAYVSSIDVSSEGITVRLEARASGSAEVTVYSERDNISFVFAVKVANGDMLLTDSRVEPYELLQRSSS